MQVISKKYKFSINYKIINLVKAKDTRLIKRDAQHD